MEYADFVEKCVKEYKETENEFVYQLIYPFCETVVEKKLSKAELEQILKKGMQKSIPLDRIKQAREEIKNIEKLDFLDTVGLLGSNNDNFETSKKFAIAILDRLISEVEEC